MGKDFVKELRWRGMIHDMTPGVQETLNQGMTAGYIGFDPSADSLHIGSLSQIMTLIHFQRAGHKPFALLGGATGRVGDPSGKSAERPLLSEQDIQHHAACIQAQLERFLDFDCGANAAEIVNNYDWFKDYAFLDFIREVGKHLTVNYMMAKESVKKRLASEAGLSFTEFSYQLVQGYDFYYLYKHKHCKIQLGGADQWGNILAGTELIRRKAQGEAWAITTPLITKADGTKFGKTEGGNVWLDKQRTSPYQFYQYWLNVSDEDAVRFIKIFTLKTQEEIDALVSEHQAAPHQRKLQQVLGKDITTRVHGAADYDMAVRAARLLFGKSTTADLEALDEQTFLDVFQGVPQARIPVGEFENIGNVTDLLSSATHHQCFSSKGEARKMIKGGGVSVNKIKINDAQQPVADFQLLNGKYLLAQKGKKHYFLMVVAR